MPAASLIPPRQQPRLLSTLPRHWPQREIGRQHWAAPRATPFKPPPNSERHSWQLQLQMLDPLRFGIQCISGIQGLGGPISFGTHSTLDHHGHKYRGSVASEKAYRRVPAYSRGYMALVLTPGATWPLCAPVGWGEEGSIGDQPHGWFPGGFCPEGVSKEDTPPAIVLTHVRTCGGP